MHECFVALTKECFHIPGQMEGATYLLISVHRGPGKIGALTRRGEIGPGCPSGTKERFRFHSLISGTPNYQLKCFPPVTTSMDTLIGGFSWATLPRITELQTKLTVSFTEAFASNFLPAENALAFFVFATGMTRYIRFLETMHFRKSIGEQRK